LGRSKKNHLLYRLLKPFAEPIKIVLQMLIGAGIVGVLAIKLVSMGLDQFLPTCVIMWLKEDGFLDIIAQNSILEIVSSGLALSAGVELAYMLFTPGPDEAVEPLILGLASTVFLVASGQGIESWQGMSSVLILILSIVILFWVRDRFVSGLETTTWKRPMLFPKRPLFGRIFPWTNKKVSRRD